MQKWSFSITRLAVGLGVVMLCMLYLLDPDSFVARYNAERYLSGTSEALMWRFYIGQGPLELILR